MSTPPDYLPWFVHRADGCLMARTQHVEDAAALIALLGDKATIVACVGAKWHVVWTEGAEEIPAGGSYDIVAEVCHRRRDRHQAQWEERHGRPARRPA